MTLLHAMGLSLAVLASAASDGSAATRQGGSAARANPNIDNAQWDAYSDQYPTSRLCPADGITLWTCDERERTHSLCASREVTATKGFIQYRTGTGGQVDSRFPPDGKHPDGLFQYDTGADGTAWITFRHGGDEYTLVDSLRDRSFITVSGRDDQDSVTISCDNGNQSLQLNYTIKLMRAAGLARQ